MCRFLDDSCDQRAKSQKGDIVFLNESKRNSYDLIINVLQGLLDGPRNKTRISYKTNLDSRTLSRHLDSLIFSGLIVKDENSSLYKITSKGMMFRNKFFEWKKMLNEKDDENSNQIGILRNDYNLNQNNSYPKLKNNFLPSNLFKIDKSIRFVGVCTTEGLLLEAEYRKGITPLISDDDLQIAVGKAAIKHSIRSDDEEKIGKIQYSMTSYENVKRLTLPFGEGLLLLISFEGKKDGVEIIKKIQDEVLLIQ